MPTPQEGVCLKGPAFARGLFFVATNYSSDAVLLATKIGLGYSRGSRMNVGG